MNRNIHIQPNKAPGKIRDFPRVDASHADSSKLEFSFGRVLVAGLLCCALLNACTTVQGVPSPQLVKYSEVVRPGDEVKCRLLDGRTVEFKVTKVEPSALKGDTEQVATGDIAHLEIRRVSKARTYGLIAAIVVAGLVAIGLGGMGPGLPSGPFVYP